MSNELQVVFSLCLADMILTDKDEIVSVSETLLGRKSFLESGLYRSRLSSVFIVRLKSDARAVSPYVQNIF